jgi:L-seryl-tRNA(Ser) seleniumtransferase
MGPAAALLRSLPQVHEILERREVQAASSRYGRELVASLLRERLQWIRASIREGGLETRAVVLLIAELGPWAAGECRALETSTLRPVINATGVVLHTNLGRGVLPESAAQRIADVARAYTTLEYDLDSGRRGSRSSHLARLTARLFPGSEVLVVNNNAGAVLLALNTLAEGREVIVSRGELVEIGGSFRIPDIMGKSGAILREVGTTNKTRIKDYERALGPQTGLLLKVHPSNYRITGFTHQAGLEEVCALGKGRRVPVLLDQGSGNLLDLVPYGIRDEPTVQEALAAGADIVACSGDKLLGGPQAGLLIGRPAYIKRMKDNPLSRVLRVDKLTYAGLEASLLEFARGTAMANLPVLRMLGLGREEIEQRARRVQQAVEERAAGRLVLTIVPGLSLTGGGAAPGEGLPTALLAVRSPERSARSLEESLRRFATPVIVRIEGGRVMIDLRTVLQDQDRLVEEALLAAAAGPDRDASLRR